MILLFGHFGEVANKNVNDFRAYEMFNKCWRWGSMFNVKACDILRCLWNVQGGGDIGKRAATPHTEHQCPTVI